MNASRRTSTGAIALVRRTVEGGRRWLAQWNDGWEAFAFVGGHKRSEESFRECLIREVEEELALTRDADFRASHEPVARLEYTAFSERARCETDYTLELFDVELSSAAVVEQVSAEPRNRWLSEPEIRRAATTGGERISSTMRLILDEAGLWSDAARARTQDRP